MSWTGTPEALLADAAAATWTLIIPQAEFESVRVYYRVSSAIPRGSSVETRILAAHQPHPQAIPTNPTLEEAYLLFQEEIGQAERPRLSLLSRSLLRDQTPGQMHNTLQKLSPIIRPY